MPRGSRGWPSRGAGRRAGSARRAAGDPAGSGSGSVTSSAAPAISPSRRAPRSARRVDDRAARRVDQVGGRLHARELGSPISPRVCGVSGRVHGDEVGALEQLLERPPAAAARVGAARSRSPPAAGRRPGRCGPCRRSRRWRRAGRGRAAARAPRCPTRRARTNAPPRRAGGMPSISATARSAVESVRTSGRVADRDQALGSRIDVDVVHPDGVVRDRAQVRARRRSGRSRSDR